MALNAGNSPLPSNLVLLDNTVTKLFSQWSKFSQHNHSLTFRNHETDAAVFRSSSRYCNSCKRTIHSTNVAGLWRCNGCDYNCCVLCMVREKALVRVNVPLSHPHTLSRYAEMDRVHDTGRFCNVCNRTVNRCGVPVLYSCLTDDFDMCFGCYALAAVTQRMTEHALAVHCSDAVRTNSHNSCDLIRQENNTRSSDPNVTCDFCRRRPVVEQRGAPIFSCLVHDTDACQACIGKYVTKGQPFAVQSNNHVQPTPAAPVIPVVPIQPHQPNTQPVYPIPLPYPAVPVQPPSQNHNHNNHHPHHPTDAEVQGLKQQIADLSRQLQAERTAHESTKQELAALRRAIGSSANNTGNNNNNVSSTGSSASNDIMHLREQVQQKDTLIAIYEGKSSTTVTTTLQRYSDEQLDTMLERSDAGQALMKSEKDRRMVCTICLTNKKAVLYLPCRHMCTCKDCSTATNSCPICREVIKERIKVYN